MWLQVSAVLGVLVVFICQSVYSQRKHGIPSYFSLLSELSVLFSVAIVAPIVEESVFRLLIPMHLNIHFGDFSVYMNHFGTLLFAVSHYCYYKGLVGNVVQIIGSFIIGHVLLSIDNVIYAILVHSLFNCTSYAITRAICHAFFRGEWETRESNFIHFADLQKWYNPKKHSEYTPEDLLDFFDTCVKLTPQLSGYDFLGRLPDKETVLQVANARGVSIVDSAENGSGLLHFAVQNCNESLIRDLIGTGEFSLFDPDGRLIPGVGGMVLFDFEIKDDQPVRKNHITLIQILLRIGTPPETVLKAIQDWEPVARKPLFMGGGSCCPDNESGMCSPEFSAYVNGLQPVIQ